VLASANWYNQRRGPDATNWATQDGWSFVHNLLSMTGTVTLQPFVNGSAVAIFNGEVYNYRELALELTGNVDAFASDGYSLLPAYRRWGEDFVRRLDGEFAVVIVDFARREVLLSPDVFGTKPLWYAIWQPNTGADGQAADHRLQTGNGGSGRRFVATSYESVLIGLGVPHNQRRLATPNRALIIPFDSFMGGSSKAGHSSKASCSRRVRAFVPPGARWFPLKVWDLRQYKTDTADWEAAFLRSVQRRTNRLKHRVFIGLSSGYDSGAIDLALKVLHQPHLAVSMEGTEDQKVLARRGELLGTEWIKLNVSVSSFERQMVWLNKHIEEYRSIHYSGTNQSSHRSPTFTITNERPAIGLSLIISTARPLSGLVYLSGQGSDEIISDYSDGPGRCFMSTSCNFDGRFPANLSTIFPWRNFYGGLNRANLMREELTAGAHGVEGRYPFLDPEVVQENLWLHQDVKNSEYKRPVADFIRKHNYPNAYHFKSGFTVFGGHVSQWKRMARTGRAQASRRESSLKSTDKMLRHSDASSRDETPVR
jgi:asparagine synthetase B (glutamine-hydrolysing)